jgi:hypothetical protein
MSTATPEERTSSDELCEDESVRKARQLTFNRMKVGPMLNSISKFIGMFGGSMFGAGLIGLIGFGGGSGLATTALAITVVGGVLQTLGIVMDYVATRVWQSTGIDQTEIGALSTAKHLVAELKANSLCLTQERHSSCRKDGKSWAEAVSSSPEEQRLHRTM